MAYGAREAIAQPTTLATAPPHVASTAPGTLEVPKSSFKAIAADEAPVSSSWAVPRLQTLFDKSSPCDEEESVPQTPRKHCYYTAAYPSNGETAVTVREIDAETELEEEEDATTGWMTAGIPWIDGGGEESFAVAISGPVRETDGYEEGFWRQSDEEVRGSGDEVRRLQEPEIVVVAAAEPFLAKRSDDAVMAAAVGIEFTLTCVDDGWSGGEVMFDDDFLFEEELMDPDYFRKKDRERESGHGVPAEMLMRSAPELFELA